MTGEDNIWGVTMRAGGFVGRKEVVGDNEVRN